MNKKKRPSSSDPFKNVPEGIPFAYHYQGQLWKVRILLTKNGQGPAPGEEKYYTIPGGSEALFQTDDVHPGFPVILVDEEMDALSIKQEAGDKIAAVAIGGLNTARFPRWIDLLKSASLVLISFPATAAGQEATAWWLSQLPRGKTWPLFTGYPNVNALLLAKSKGSVRRWVLSGIEEGQIGEQAQ